MRNVLIFLSLLISIPALAAPPQAVLCRSEKLNTVYKLLIEDTALIQADSSFMQKDVHLLIATPFGESIWELIGFYTESFHTIEINRYVGLFIPFDGNPLANDKYLHIKFEKNRNKGIGHLKHYDLTGVDSIVTLDCTIDQSTNSTSSTRFEPNES